MVIWPINRQFVDHVSVFISLTRVIGKYFWAFTPITCRFSSTRINKNLCCCFGWIRDIVLLCEGEIECRMLTKIFYQNLIADQINRKVVATKILRQILSKIDGIKAFKNRDFRWDSKRTHTEMLKASVSRMMMIFSCLWTSRVTKSVTNSSWFEWKIVIKTYKCCVFDWSRRIRILFKKIFPPFKSALVTLLVKYICLLKNTLHFWKIF